MFYSRQKTYKNRSNQREEVFDEEAEGVEEEGEGSGKYKKYNKTTKMDNIINYNNKKKNADELTTIATKLLLKDKKKTNDTTKAAIAAAKEATKKIPKPSVPIYRRAFNNDDDAITVVTQAGYDPSKPYVYQINLYADTVLLHDNDENDTTEPEYTPMPLYCHPPKFRIPQDFDPTLEPLSYLVYPDSSINKIVKYTNMYATARHAKEKVKFKVVTNADILLFLAMYYYMGLVWCPARKDYWRQDPSIGQYIREHRRYVGIF